MSTRFTRVLFGAVLLAAAVAQAKVVYVVPGGAGAKDGTSWGDAYDDIIVAYTNAADGATAEVPGEVWIKKGWYQYPTTHIVMKPYVKMFGGFEGGETSVDAADPENNWTIVSVGWYALDTSKYYWRDTAGKKITPVWSKVGQDYVYTPPPETGWCVISGSGQDNFMVDTDGAADGNEINGIVLTCCVKSVISVSHGTKDLLVKNCRFIGCSLYQHQGIGGEINASDADLMVVNCRFEGGQNPIHAKSSTELHDCTVSNCQFACCYGNYGGGCAGVSGEGLVRLHVADCSFERGWVDNNALALDVYLGCITSKVSNCSFALSRDFNAGGSVPGIRCAYTDGTMDIERCQFKRVYVSHPGTAYTSGACVMTPVSTSGMSVIVRDSYFEGNVLELTDKPDNNNRVYGCIMAMYGGNWHSLVNCTVVSNAVIDTFTGNSPHVAMVAGGYDTVRLVVDSCTFKDNDCLRIRTVDEVTTTNRLGEIDFGGANKSMRSIINTVMTHAAEDYKPFSSSANICGAMCTKGYTITSGRAPLLSCDPQLADGPETKDGVTAWGVRPESPCRKGGYFVWEGTDRQFYFRDPTATAATPWRSLTSNGLLSDADAAAVGVSLAAKPLPDAFGEARSAGHIALGSLNADPLGLMLLVR